MNKKKILGAVCALACVTNFAFIQPVSAKIMNAHEQENWARHEEMEEFNGRRPETHSDEAKRLTPIVQGLQKRICDKNGIEVTSALFQNTYDFEKKVHPVQVVDNYNNAVAVGAGYIYYGVDSLRSKGVVGLSNQYDYIICEHTLAHELAHAIGGHSTSYKKFHDNQEELAEKASVKLMDKLPEGGWGAYLVGIYKSPNRPEINEEIKRSFVKAAGGEKVITMPVYATTVYHSKSGEYNLCIKSGESSENAYFGGQIAECIARGALSLENLDVAPVSTELKQSIKFKGDYILVCRSNKLPNGYRIIASLYGSQDKVMDEWNRMKGLVAHGNSDIRGYSNMANLTFRQGKYNMWKMWLALAVAKDVQNR